MIRIIPKGTFLFHGRVINKGLDISGPSYFCDDEAEAQNRGPLHIDARHRVTMARLRILAAEDVGSLYNQTFPIFWDRGKNGEVVEYVASRDLKCMDMECDTTVQSFWDAAMLGLDPNTHRDTVMDAMEATVGYAEYDEFDNPISWRARKQPYGTDDYEYKKIADMYATYMKNGYDGFFCKTRKDIMLSRPTECLEPTNRVMLGDLSRSPLDSPLKLPTREQFLAQAKIVTNATILLNHR